MHNLGLPEYKVASSRIISFQFECLEPRLLFCSMFPSMLTSKQEDMPSLKTETKHSWILLLVISSFGSPCSQIVESAISKVLSGRASSTNLCRSSESPNISSVGLLPVNISSSNMPRL